MQRGKWTATEVADRFEEAARTLKRLPKESVQGYFNTWPGMIRTVWEQLGAEKLPTRLGPPSPQAIDRMEETVQWIFLLDDEDERRLVWLRAERIYWKQICWRLGIGKTKAREIWTLALIKICHHLNSRKA